MLKIFHKNKRKKNISVLFLFELDSYSKNYVIIIFHIIIDVYFPIEISMETMKILVLAKYLIERRNWWIFGYFPSMKCIPMKIFFFGYNIHFELGKSWTIPNNSKPMSLFTVYPPKIFSMKNFDNDYYPMEFACLWAKGMRYMNKQRTGRLRYVIRN